MRPRVAVVITSFAAATALAACEGEKERSGRAGDPEAWKADNPMQIVLIGPPGAGKGTQGGQLSGKYRVPHITTGGIFRDELQKGSEIGISVQRIMERGDLVPVEVVVYLVRQRLQEADCRKGFILDGFPRTEAQLDSLHVLLAERGHDEYHAFLIDVPDGVILERLLARGRADDTEDTIRRRLEVYRERTEPLVARFDEQGALTRVNGDQDIDAVFKDIDNAVTDQWPNWR